MKNLALEQWLKHRRFIATTWVLITGLVAGLYAVETSMVTDQIRHVLSLPDMRPADTITALAADLAVLTPGQAPDHGLGLIMATVIGTVLATTLGARLGASEHRWRTAAGYVVRHTRGRAALGNLVTAAFVLLSWAVLSVVVAWISAIIASAALSTHLPGLSAYTWREPVGHVLGQVIGASATRFLDVALAFVVAALTRSTLAALVVPLGASLAQLAVAGEAAPGSWWPAVSQVSVWGELLRYQPDGGLLYSPLGSNGAALAVTLTATVTLGVLLAAAAHHLTTHREVRAS